MEIKIHLKEKDIPRKWYNLAADLPTPLLPPLGPDGKPIGPEMLAPVFPMNLIEQEVSTKRWIDIPEEILDILYRWRPAPLRRAVYLERFLKTPARIYYKDESTSPPGSHKPNTAVPQAWYNKQFGIKRLITETGAGQWGSALAFACQLIGLECKVFMVRISFDQKPFRKLMMQVWGANCVASPSNETNAGRKILTEMPNTPGSLGIAISEAIEQTVTDPTGQTRYSPWKRLKPRYAPPDNHRPRSQEALAKPPAKRRSISSSAAQAAAPTSRALIPVRHRQNQRRKYQNYAHRTKLLPIPDSRAFLIRLRRHGGNDTIACDVHNRTYLYPRPDSRRRPSLSRHGASGQPGHLSKDCSNQRHIHRPSATMQP